MKKRILLLSGLLTFFVVLTIFNNQTTENTNELFSDRSGFSKRQYNLAKWKYKIYDPFDKVKILQRKLVTQDLISLKTVEKGKVRYRYLDKQNKLVIPPVLDQEAYFYSPKYALARINGKLGVLDSQGRAITPFLYDDIDPYISGYRQGFIETIKQEYIEAIQGYKKGIADLDGNTIVPFEFDDIISFTSDVAIVRKGSRFGFVDRQQQYHPLTVKDNGDYFSTGIALLYFPYHGDDRVSYISDRYCVVNRQGKLLVPAEAGAGTQTEAVAEKINNTCRNLATKKASNTDTKASNTYLTRVFINDKYGYINNAGQLTISPQYDNAEDFNQGYAFVFKDKQLGIIDTKGKYTSLTVKNNNYFTDGIVRVGYVDSYGDRYCVINQQGELLVSATSSISVKAQKINNICRGLAGIKVNNDSLQEPLQSMDERPFSYYFVDGLLTVIINNKRGYINSKGDLAIPQLFDTAANFSEGLAAVKQDGRFGFIDRSGKMVLKANNYIPYSGYINGTNNLDCPDGYLPNTLSSFEGDLAKVSRVDNLNQLDDDYCNITERPKYYYLNRQNQIVAGDLIYDVFTEATELASGLIKVKTAQGYELLKPDGEIVEQ